MVWRKEVRGEEVERLVIVYFFVFIGVFFFFFLFGGGTGYIDSEWYNHSYQDVSIHSVTFESSALEDNFHRRDSFISFCKFLRYISRPQRRLNMQLMCHKGYCTLVGVDAQVCAHLSHSRSFRHESDINNIKKARFFFIRCVYMRNFVVFLSSSSFSRGIYYDITSDGKLDFRDCQISKSFAFSRRGESQPRAHAS